MKNPGHPAVFCLSNLSLITLSRNESSDSICSIHPIVFSINPNKAPGPDRLNAKFYQSFWYILKPDVQNMVSTFFIDGTFYHRLNETTIVLVPKKAGPVSIKDYRPISL